MSRTAVLNIVGLTSGLISEENTPAIDRYCKAQPMANFAPTFPALTCSAQATYMTGRDPGGHGIVGNGWYNRSLCEVQFWKQPDALVQGQKIWHFLRDKKPEARTAKLFWWYNMYSEVEYAMTPRPMYPADGRKVFDIYTQPPDIRFEIQKKEELGPFPFRNFWGPAAGIGCSDWIASSALWIEERQRPDLSLVYLPHLDYALQKVGPGDPGIAAELRAIDAVVGRLLDSYAAAGVSVLLLSEYGITAVDRPLHLNRLFREKGWLTVKDELGLELHDPGASKVFAVADHQVAHVYCNDPSLLGAVRELLESVEGVEQVLAPDDLGWGRESVARERGGDLVAVADARSWFTYYYWFDDAVAPDFARCIDIHRKPGYDPVELWIDPGLRFPTLRVLKFLLKKKLGFRGLLDVIPLDAGLVGGSHGRRSEDPWEQPLIVGPTAERVRVDTDVCKAILASCLES